MPWSKDQHGGTKTERKSESVAKVLVQRRPWPLWSLVAFSSFPFPQDAKCEGADDGSAFDECLPEYLLQTPEDQIAWRPGRHLPNRDGKLRGTHRLGEKHGASSQIDPYIRLNFRRVAHILPFFGMELAPLSAKFLGIVD